MSARRPLRRPSLRRASPGHLDQQGVPDDVLLVGWTFAVAVAIVLVGFGLRWWVLRSTLGGVDVDEATVGLQAQHILEGHPATFFPTQQYGGTLETSTVALAFGFFGVGAGTLKVVPVVFHLVACIVVWRTARRLRVGPVAALVAPTVLWLGPAAGIWESTKERGFYGAAIVLAALVLHLVVREHQRHARSNLAALGLCVGLAVWTTPLLAAAVVPPVAWLIVGRRRTFGRDPLAVLAAATGVLIGASPWLIWNVRHGWESMASPPSFGTTWLGRFEDWMHRLGTIVGTTTPWTGRALLPSVVVLVVIFAGVAVAARSTLETAPGLLAVAVLGFGVLLACNGLAISVGPDPRYLYPMLPALALTASAAAANLPSSRLGLVGLGAIAAGCALLSAWGLVGLDRDAGRDGQELFLASPGLDRVIAALEARHIGTAITDTSGHQITFATRGRIQASTYGIARFAETERAARRNPTTYVLRNGYMGGDDERLRKYLLVHRISYDHRSIGIYQIFYLDEPVLPEEIPLRTFAGAVRAPGEGP